jgi:hypothetical protein
MRQELVSGVGKKELKFYIENEIKNKYYVAKLNRNGSKNRC